MTRLVTFITGVLCFMFSTRAYAQQFYVCKSNGMLNLVTVTPGGVVSQSVQGCGDYAYFSIAVLRNKLFYNTTSGAIYTADINVSGGSAPSISNCSFITSNTLANSLTVDSNGILYYAFGNQLYSIDPKNPTPVSLGSMPYSSAGDLIFYNNQLFMAAPEGIVQIPLDNPSLSTLYIPIPNQVIFGLTNVGFNGTNLVYALTSTGGGTNLLELDMQNRLVKGNAGTLPYVVYDAGSEAEAGVVPSIEVDSTNISQECNAFNSAHVQVYCKTHTDTYTFTLNTGQSDTTGIFDNLPPGNYTLTITSAGSALPKIITFTVPDYTTGNPVITEAQTNPVCTLTGQIKLDAGTADTAYSVQYLNSVFSFPHTFSGLSAGGYHFTILKKNGCIADEKDYMLQQDTCPPVVITNVLIQPECNVYGEAKVQVTTNSHPDTYTYSLNNVTDTTGFFDFLTPGSYQLTVTSSVGNEATQQVNVPDFTLNKPPVSYTVKNADCNLPGEIRFTLTGDSAANYKIEHDSVLYAFNQTITGLNPGASRFNVLNQQGCIIDTLNVNILHDVCEPIVFPNTFTPNGDGINDIFRPNQNSSVSNFNMMIYNRWGAKLFQSSAITNGWDGTYNGKATPAGVYYWVATYTKPDGSQARKSGYVTLIR